MSKPRIAVYLALSVIPLLISACPTKVDVPYLVGMVRADAENSLHEADLQVGTVTSVYSDTAAAGTVVSHNPPQGTSVDRDTRVDLVLSRGRVILVNVDSPVGDSSQDGLSWGTAYSELQAAVEAAYFRSAEIWVARGGYDENRILTDANGSLVLHPGVRMYGGFAAVEHFREDRNWQSNVTIIDGRVARGGAAANPVVQVADETVVDGFVIEGGDGPGAGGGVSLADASATLANCTIRDNAAGNGAGIYASDNSLLVLTNCTFSENAAESYGGAVYSEGEGIDASRCTFIGNTADVGAAVSAWSEDVEFDRCLFMDNAAASYGGAIYIEDTVSLEVLNCIFDGNAADGSGGGVHFDSDGVATIINSTFYANSAPVSDGASCYVYDGAMAIYNCILGGGFGADEVDAEEPSGSVTGSHNYVEDGSLPGASTENPLFFNAAGGDYRLQTGSPCIDTGHAPNASDHDFRGVARPQGAGPDIGAYEMTASDYE